LAAEGDFTLRHFFGDHAEEILQCHIVDVEDLDQRFESNIGFSLLDPPILDLRQVVFMRKFPDGGVAFLDPELSQALADENQNIFKRFIGFHNKIIQVCSDKEKIVCLLCPLCDGMIFSTVKRENRRVKRPLGIEPKMFS
jgi:hypothetical protein